MLEFCGPEVRPWAKEFNLTHITSSGPLARALPQGTLCGAPLALEDGGFHNANVGR